MTAIRAKKRDDKVAAQWGAIRQMRDALRDAPVTLADGRTFDADVISVQTMQETLDRWGDVTYMRDTQGRQLWKAADNSVHAFTKSQFVSLLEQIRQRRAVRLDACFAFSEQLRAQLPLPDDHPALAGQGWPA